MRGKMATTISKFFFLRETSDNQSMLSHNIKINNRPSPRVVRLGRVSLACRCQAHEGPTSLKAREEMRKRDWSEHDQATKLKKLVKFVALLDGNDSGRCGR